ncbi:MAG TPA: LD-carboxypeptidase [Lentimicrobium sp.]|nr:LD-carboxypeptidase [Lentimicrobium sp.]
MTTPPFLKAGDLIAITSTARKITREELQPSIDLFKSWGLYVMLASNLFEADNQFAGTDEQRTTDFQSLLDDENVKAIFCARGGYGTVRIIDKLDFTKFRSAPKWIIGYSDVTVLHSHISTNYNIETLHAIMPVNFSADSKEAKKSFESLYSTLFGELPAYKAGPNNFNRTGEARGQITGGNLSILYSLLGSNSDIETTGKILFLEDIDEYLYHIDRMMQSLKRAGKLSNLAGLAVGHFTNMRDNEIPFGKRPEEIITEAVREYNYPIAFGILAGHEPENMPLILGREVMLQVTNSESNLKFMEPLESRGLRRFKNIFKPALWVIGGFVILYLLYSFLLGRFT